MVTGFHGHRFLKPVSRSAADDDRGAVAGDVGFFVQALGDFVAELKHLAGDPVLAAVGVNEFGQVGPTNPPGPWAYACESRDAIESAGNNPLPFGKVDSGVFATISSASVTRK